MPAFGRFSEARLKTCHQDLQDLFNEVIKHKDCTVIQGHRGRAEQEAAFAEGKSKARFGQSKHNSVPSNAVDVMPYPINWNDKEGVRDFANFVLGVAAVMGIKIKWGGHFRSFFDGPHYELED